MAQKKVVSDADLDQEAKEMAKVLGEQKKVKLFIPHGLGIQDPLPVAINGAIMAIPIGRDVEVPQAVYNLIMKQSNVMNRNYGKTEGVEEKALKGGQAL